MSVTADNSKTINRKPSEAWMFLDTVISLLPDCLQRKNTNIFIQENTSKMEVPFPLLLRFVFWVLVKSVLNIPWKDWCWSWNSNTLATWWELTHWKRPWCWERLKAGEGDDRGWDGWMASPTQWTWVWEALVAGDGQGGLACCSPWGHKESDMTDWLNWTELKSCYHKPRRDTWL